VTRIIVFAKQPLPGRVKTRLIPALGADGAAKLAADMLARTVDEALGTGLGVELCGEPDAGAWFERPVAKTAQGEGDLGQRLARAARRVLAEEPVLLIGADCPSLDRRRLRAAADSLAAHDAVIHPAQDGGYVLLGLARLEESLFEGIAWSTPTVCADTVARIEALGWALDIRETLADVDEPADLHRHPRESGDPVQRPDEHGPMTPPAGFPLSRE
jgi:rSAM/selenodomain-associated transferase 1